MPEATHTPGPWLVARNGKAGHTYRIWRNDHNGELSPDGENAGWACIATSVWGEANARLVAAAPDLLTALTGLLAVIVDSDQRPQPSTMRLLGIVSGKPEFKAIDAARLAVRKAIA